MIYGYVSCALGEWPITAVALQPDGRINISWTLGPDEAWPRGERAFDVLDRDRNLVCSRVYSDAGEKVPELGCTWEFSYALQVRP